jgi:hypothetical protein
VTMIYNVINTSPKMAINTTHLTDLLTSAAMSCLDLSNKSVRHLLVYVQERAPCNSIHHQFRFRCSTPTKPVTL